jgi:hypothetical protein
MKTMESMRSGRNADLIPYMLRRLEHRFKRIRRPDLKLRYEALVREFGVAPASAVRPDYFDLEDDYDPDEEIDPKKTNNFLRFDAAHLVKTMESMRSGKNVDLIPYMLRRHEQRFKRIRHPDLKLRYEALVREFGSSDHIPGSSGPST